MQLPDKVERPDLMAALRPFFDLIGVDQNNLASEPAIEISASGVRFTTVSPRAEVTIPVVDSVNTLLGRLSRAQIAERERQIAHEKRVSRLPLFGRIGGFF